MNVSSLLVTVHSNHKEDTSVNYRLGWNQPRILVFFPQMNRNVNKVWRGLYRETILFCFTLMSCNINDFRSERSWPTIMSHGDGPQRLWTTQRTISTNNLVWRWCTAIVLNYSFVKMARQFRHSLLYQNVSNLKKRSPTKNRHKAFRFRNKSTPSVRSLCIVMVDTSTSQKLMRWYVRQYTNILRCHGTVGWDDLYYFTFNGKRLDDVIIPWSGHVTLE